MSEAKTCAQCGAEVDGQALFCSRCGQDMTLVGDDAPTLEVTTAGSPIQPVRSTMRQALREATLGEYEILSELGRGGMATVFLAHDIALDRKVAIKVMAPHLLEGEGMAERFKLEARTAAQLSHPHIIPIYAVKETAETLYFVMKYVEGRGLDSIIKKTGPLPIPMVRDILTKVGSALGYAHRRDVIHRDIKPGNIMIDEEGTPIVTDFGIAKVAENKGLTMTGTTIGTPSYMSPEQCEAKQVTGASDQYSLGIVAFEMLTGKLPFEGDSAVTTMYKHCHEPLPPLEDFRPDCPAEIRETVVRMVAKDPAERWPSLEAAVRRLSNDSTPTGLDPIRSHLMELVKEGDAELIARLSDPSGPVAARGTGPGRAGAGGAPVRSRRGVVAMVAVVAALGVGGALVLTQPWAQGSPAAVTPSQPAATGGADGASSPESGGPADAVAPGGATADVGASPPAASDPAGGRGQTPEAEPPPGGATATNPQDAGPAAGATNPPASSSPVVRSVEITGAPARMEPGDRVTLTARPTDGNGDPVRGLSMLWTSTDETVARVGPDGTVTAQGPGQVVLTAAAGGASGSVGLTVAEVPVASISLDRTGLTLTVGARAVVGARTLSADGSSLAGRGVNWVSSDESVASVTGTGEVTARGPGTATVTASSGSVRASLAVNVGLTARAAVQNLVAAYALALESRDVAQVRSVYPRITQERETQLRDALPNMQNLQVDYEIESVEERDDTAVAQVSATYRYQYQGRSQTQAVPLRFTIARTGIEWRVTSIE